jgi:hypothetical protein
MRNTFAIESNDSPAPGVIPEPVRVHDQPAVPTRRVARRAAVRAPKRPPGQRHPVRIILAKVLSVIHGEKYMVGAFPPAGHGDAATRNGDGLFRPNHQGVRPAGVQLVAPPEPSEAERAAPAKSTKER